MPNDLDHLAYLLKQTSKIAAYVEAHTSFDIISDKQSNKDYCLADDDIMDDGIGHGCNVVLACLSSAEAALGGAPPWLINSLSPWHNCTSCAGA